MEENAENVVSVYQVSLPSVYDIYQDFYQTLAVIHHMNNACGVLWAGFDV